MKGRKETDYPDQMLGLAILRARTELYNKYGLNTRCHETIGAFMGISRTAVQLIENKAMRRLRYKLASTLKGLGLELNEALKALSKGHQ